MSGTAEARQAGVSVVRTLRDAGHVALFAGGCVRDLLMGRTPKDFDVATDATPEQVRKLFRRTVEVGVAFGVMRVMIGPEQIEVATFRADVSYTDGRRPDAVRFTDARTDAQRRDFTINGMFLDPLTDEVHDYVGGRADLAAKVIRAIGEADQRFAEDRLRLLRAVRFASTLGFAVEPATADAVRRHAPEIGDVSAERIRDEASKFFKGAGRVRGIELMWSFGLMAPVLPMVTSDYDGARELPAGLRRALARLPESAGWDAALAVLVKGPPTACGPCGIGPNVDVHPALAQLAGDRVRRLEAEVFDRLAMPRIERDRVAFLVRHQWDLDFCAARDLAWKKRMFAQPFFAELEDFCRARAVEFPVAGSTLEPVLDLWRSLTPEQIKPKPLVNGGDLLTMGLPAGPAMGRLLADLYDAQLRGELTDREAALAAARRGGEG